MGKSSEVSFEKFYLKEKSILSRYIFIIAIASGDYMSYIVVFFNKKFFESRIEFLDKNFKLFILVVSILLLLSLFWTVILIKIFLDFYRYSEIKCDELKENEIEKLNFIARLQKNLVKVFVLSIIIGFIAFPFAFLSDSSKIFLYLSLTLFVLLACVHSIPFLNICFVIFYIQCYKISYLNKIRSRILNR